MERLCDAHIKVFLEEAPLYVWYEYLKPRINRGSRWINEIDSSCSRCGQIRPFHDLRTKGGGAGIQTEALRTGHAGLVFTCVSCGKEERIFGVFHEVSENSIKFQKYGEWPRMSLDRDKVLQKFLKNDAEHYEKALASLANGYGIAAFAYLRRIIENNISRLLDMISADIDSSSQNEKLKKSIEELRKESPMSDKIKIANNALPKYLKPGGVNPLGRLYQVLSEGVHRYSDKECLERSMATKKCLKYLITELASRKKHQDQFKDLVGKL